LFESAFVIGTENVARNWSGANYFGISTTDEHGFQTAKYIEETLKKMVGAVRFELPHAWFEPLQRNEGRAATEQVKLDNRTKKD
jgi:hypothetical protein